MSIDNNKPPDPIVEEFRILTKMTSSDDVRLEPLNDTKVEVVKGKLRKPHRGSRIKVSTPGSSSAGAGSMLKRLRSAKISGKARVRVDSSPLDNRGGKRVVSSPKNDVIKKVLSDVRSSAIDNFKFAIGSSIDNIDAKCSMNCDSDVNEVNIGLNPINDGSFIKEPLCPSNDSITDIDSESLVAFSSKLKDSVEPASMGDVGNASHAHLIPLVSTTPAKTGMDFEFGKVDSSKGILKKPSSPLLNVQFGSNIPCNPFVKNSNGLGSKMMSNQYSTAAVSFAEKFRRISFSAEERTYGIMDITKTNLGIFYFKFKSEEGMKNVLETGPWMVQNITLVLNIWELGIWLEKVEPSVIPIWVCIYNIPMELCIGSSIGKIMSGIGKPLLMDKMTKDRCLRKAGKLDFARVLVEISAGDELPNMLEIAYPPIGNSPAKVGRLDVKYQWKPPLCTHCKTFGHSTLSCKVRPRTEEENAAAILKEALKVGSGQKDVVGSSLNDDDFVTVGKKNKPVDKKVVPPLVNSYVNQGFKMQNRGGFNSGKQQGNGYQYNGKQGNKTWQVGKGFKKQGSFVGNESNKQQGGSFKKNADVKSNSKNDNSYDVGIQKKSLRQLSQDPNFKPKVLVRGSGSSGNIMRSQEEFVPVSNSFGVLSEEAMNEEYDNSIWPKLKGDVDDLMENGIYPSKEIRADWSLRQMEYFYNNCHKFHLDPSYEDEEDDVNSEVDGVATDMKPEFEVDSAEILVNNSAIAQDVSNDNYGLCGLLETHVKKKNLAKICNRVLGNWDWVSNNSSCVNGTRIIIGWDPNVVNVMVLDQDSQVVHCYVEPINGGSCFFCSFVYAAIHTVDRRSLWKALHKHKFVIKDRPWVILGDFNACLDPSERSSGCSKVTTAMCDFRECVTDIEVDDIAMNGLKFTWNKKPGKVGGLLKKLDRVLGNGSFISSFPTAFARFLPFMLSDHTPAVFVIPEVSKPKPKPFKFHNYLSSKDEFIPTVSRIWNNKIEGFSMYSLVSKLKMLKKPLRKLNFDQGNLFENVKRLRSDLAAVQSSLCADPHNGLLREAEAKTFKAYKSALKDEELFLKQKANRAVSDDEIKKALFSIDGNKAPGPDGFSANFFKDSWSIVGSEVCQAVKDFFRNGMLLKEVNATIISLVPKTATPSISTDDSSWLIPGYERHEQVISRLSSLLILSLVIEDLKLTHLCFADDILLFCHGDSNSAAVFKLALDEFGGMSGLLPNKIKSVVFFGNVRKVARRNILKGRSFWDIPEKAGACWAWKNLLRYRDLFRDHIVHKIGDGLSTSLWFDNWSVICPLNKFISRREILSSGLSLNCNVAEIIKDGMWDWPAILTDKYDGLLVIPPPCLISGKADKVVWRNNMGRHNDFSVSEVWNDIRSKNELVPWSKLVWFSQCIPRHSFMLWLAILRRLKTHDLMKKWDNDERLFCVFCRKVPDSHSHLFFECDFPKKIWCNLKEMVKLDHAPNSWPEILNFILKRPINKSIWSILQRLVLGACVYVVWQERNMRTFQNYSRSVEEVCSKIKDEVRLRVLSLSLNPSIQVYEAADLWNFHVCNEIGSKRVKFSARKNSS
ncbi:RNA-directed DNA polymerase, eukaryota, reverse transcriptase zinc-binding domain protein [Tanacetum coccineum]